MNDKSFFSHMSAGPSKVPDVPFEKECPKCGCELEKGYGLAFGGGHGTYQTCNGCGWATKHLDSVAR